LNFDEIENITIFGVGLIGGSLGLALKKYGFRGSITGLGRRMSTLEIALERQAVDQITTAPVKGLTKAQLVIIATPVDLIPISIQKFLDYVPKGCIFTDVGSVKGLIVSRVEEILTDSLYFVGAHPMAGSEKSGIKAARPNLFDGSTCIITPTESTDQDIYQVVKELWEIVGSNVKIMSPDEHDYIIGAASHLPHIIACVLTQTVAGTKNNQNNALDFTATGFRDTTRIAAGLPDIWRPILKDNSKSLIEMIDAFIDNLKIFKQSLIDCDEEKITKLLAEAKDIRDSLS